MTVGTSYFTSKAAAVRYYRDYEGNQASKAVEQKLTEGEIHIGKPTLKAGETLSVIDNGCRYAISDPPPPPVRPQAIRSLSIHGRKWFDRVNGNTYFSAYALIDGVRVAGIAYEYGYGNQFEWEMFAQLDHLCLLPEPRQGEDGTPKESAWRYCERLGIAYTSDVVDVPRKRDL